MSARRRVAITGIGLVTPIGNDVAATWAALDSVKNGAAPITLFDASGFPTRIAAEVKDFDERVITAPRKALKFANRSHRFALAAAEEAMRDAGIEPTDADGARWGCAVGTGMMGVDFADLAAVQRHSAPGGEIDPRKLLSDDSAADPRAFCRSQSTAGLALLTRRFGIRGYATSVHTACASGGQAIGTALKLIRRGAVDRALAGGFDSMISPVGLAGFCLLSAVSTDNDTPERASRPFDATRNGFVLGEGAGFLVLEEWDAARARGARIYAELAGDGNSLSSYRITDSPPDGDGPIQSMRAALGDARRDAGGRRLHQRARHVDRHERSQRDRRHPRSVRRGREARLRQLDEELDGSPDRRRGCSRGCDLRARDRPRRDAGQRELPHEGRRLRPQSGAGKAAATARADDALQFVRLRRLE